MNRAKKLLALLLALTLAVICAGCGGGGQTETTAEPTAGQTAAMEQPQDTAHGDDITVDTEYGTLYYPAQWTEFIQMEQSSEGDATVVSFSAKINENSYSLFSITIGGEGDNPAGTLTGPDGTQRNVYVQITELEQSDTLSEGEQNRLYAMQEDINYLLDSLK